MGKSKAKATGLAPTAAVATSAVFLLSAAVIALELALMRCLAVAQWHHFSYLVISTALLGFGASGTFLCFAGPALRRRYAASSFWLTWLFATSGTASFVLAQTLPVDIQYVFYSLRQAGILALYHLLMLVPFLQTP